MGACYGTYRTVFVLYLSLLLAPTALAHGEQHGHAHEDMIAGSENPPPKGPSQYPPTYFAHPDHVAWIYAHIVLAVLSSVFVLPVAVMLSIVRSRYTLLTQFVFMLMNAISLVCAVFYNANTPDLYPNNAHHKIGWIVTWVISAHTFVSLIGRLSDIYKGQGQNKSPESRAFLPFSRRVSWHRDYFSANRDSNDSGQGTERNTASLRSSSASSMHEEGGESEDRHKEYDEPAEAADFETLSLSESDPASRFSKTILGLVSSTIWKYVHVGYCIVDRILLPFAFIAFATGIITFGRFFEGGAIFSGLAHWIKGGVFFWLGLLTLGRWSGSFADLGWAWNLRRKRSTRQIKWQPSAEFVESFLIFFYGATNIFLEHLGSWGKGWSAQDLEHVSLTVLFIGGGLLGMLVESSRARELLNMTASETLVDSDRELDEESACSEPPTTYEFSLNPIPALVILLVGIMMSSHQQETMISSMIHKQWGNLLTGAAFSRGLTYVLLFLRTPKSSMPSRPPTEILAAFGLISGGIIFMASSSDTVDGMIHYELDAMFMYTVTMGLVGVLMAWELTVLAIKGWASRYERLHGR